jgi:hypothetical protein
MLIAEDIINVKNNLKLNMLRGRVIAHSNGIA